MAAKLEKLLGIENKLSTKFWSMKDPMIIIIIIIIIQIIMTSLPYDCNVLSNYLSTFLLLR